MNKVIKYFVWNLFIIGTLAIGYFLNERGIPSMIVGVYYSIITFALLLCIIGVGSKDIKKTIIKSMSLFSAWKYPFEILFIFFAIYMGYHKIGIAMFFETACILYFHVSLKEWKKEIDASEQEAAK